MQGLGQGVGAGSMCRGGGSSGQLGTQEGQRRMDCGLQSVNPTFPPTHLWPGQPQLLPFLHTPHAEQSCLCPAMFGKPESSRRGVP